MSEVTTPGLDLAKNAFQVHGADGAGRTVMRRKLRRDQVLAFFSALPPCTVATEACVGSRLWGREIARLGERSLRRLLILGANSVIIKRMSPAARPGTWLAGMLSRKPPMLVRVALANKRRGSPER